MRLVKKRLMCSPYLTSQCKQTEWKLSQSTPYSRRASLSVGIIGSLQPSKKCRCLTKHAYNLNSAGSNTAETDKEYKQASHNILKRQCRNNLKSYFQELRSHIPKLEDNQWAPKVTIFLKATEFITAIVKRNESLDRKYEQEKRREAQLKQRLAELVVDL